jgi:uncharacterized membrane protein SirB2
MKTGADSKKRKRKWIRALGNLNCLIVLALSGINIIVIFLKAKTLPLVPD